MDSHAADHAHDHSHEDAHDHMRTHGEHGHDDDGRPRIAFIGAGHVGTALGASFARAGWQVTAVASRDPGRRDAFRERVPGARAFSEAQGVLDEAELIFVTVPDDAIADTAAAIQLYSGQALVHTSGALPATVLAPAMAAGTNIGSFHPLVSFADFERALASLAGATVALDGDPAILPLLAELAESIGAQPVLVPAGGKAAYHAAAMLAAGGVVGLLDAIAQLGAVAGLDEPTALRVYLPLMRQAIANAEALGIAAALSGPFVRGDQGTIEAHLAALREHAADTLPLYLEIARRELDIAVRRGDLDAESAKGLEVMLDRSAAGD